MAVAAPMTVRLLRMSTLVLLVATKSAAFVLRRRMRMPVSISDVLASTGVAVFAAVGFELAGILHGGFLGRFVV
jgi:hypothetical protein